jgi:protein-tyrosine phosphatase
LFFSFDTLAGMFQILIVCMGNICRSPMAQSVMQADVARRGLAHAVQVDSAGTYAGHQGEKPDRRAMALAKSRGYAQIEKLRARRVREEDFERFDLILVMDDLNMDRMRFACPREHQHKLHLFLEYAGVEGMREVPDPYRGNAQDFEQVLALCEQGSEGVLNRVASALP